MNKPFIVKANGKQEPFSSKKFLKSLSRSGTDSSTAKTILKKVYPSIYSGMSTREIYNLTQKELQSENRPSSYRYALKRAIFELGPSGFPFEKLIGRLCEKLNYKAETNLTISGKCVDHEVDVLAQTSKEIGWVECKFHNVQGVVVDLKTALYVFGRSIDLKEASKDSRKKIMWLVTNTRFTTEAIRLAECRGMKIIGWDYPEQGGLNVLLEKYNLYPITCVTSLSRRSKMELIENGIITCEDFQQYNAKKLSKLSIPEKKKVRLKEDFVNLPRV